MENKLQVITTDCEITKKQFTDEKGNAIDYYDYVIVINGQRIKVKPITECKQLANYLLASIIK